MILYPAVDILGGKAVRLRQGDFDEATVYESSPLEAARSWVEEGAGFLHVVDLDGARSGQPANLDHLRQITGELNVPVQVGGGLRSVESVRAALDSGVERVVLGTAALRDQEFLDDCLGICRDRLIVSVDVSGGRVAVDGWQEVTGGEPEAVLESLMSRGCARSSIRTSTVTGCSRARTWTRCGESPESSVAGSSTPAASEPSRT